MAAARAKRVQAGLVTRAAESESTRDDGFAIRLDDRTCRPRPRPDCRTVDRGVCAEIGGLRKSRGAEPDSFFESMMETQHAWETWVGRTEIASDHIGVTPIAALRATLDDPAADVAQGTPLPPLWHWLYCLPLHRQSDIGPDGHVRRAGFLPPVTLPRRMWAGGRLTFRTPLRVGDDIERTSTIEDVTMKEGRSGQLVFVSVRHDIRANGAVDPAISEWQDLVYRAAQKPEDPVPPPTKAPTGARWVRSVVPDEVMLFRYSALTFNGHRIHYDRRYATDVEGYPGLIVHGPLIATLLVDVIRRELTQATVETFRFRAVRPAFALNTLQLNCALEPDGKTVRLWAEDPEGWLTMDASATIA